VHYHGVAVHSLWPAFPDGDMDRELDVARDAGSNVVKVDVAWASLEARGKGQISEFYALKIDRFFAAAAARGMKVVATLWASPCWASSAPEWLKRGCPDEWNAETARYPPANPADYGDIARWMTSRYGTRIAALEIWNEPNLRNDFYWKAPDGAVAYAALARAAYPAAKVGNPNVPVIVGALVRPDIAFMRALYSNGIRGSYDGVSIHPYGVELTAKKLNAFNRVRVTAGDRTAMWITEWGAPTGTDTFWSVSDRDQARAITRGAATIDRLTYIRGATLYNLRDTGTDQTNNEQNFGVVRYDFSPKPGYGALRAALRRPCARSRAGSRRRAKRLRYTCPRAARGA
jgi:hypothetical protein